MLDHIARLQAALEDRYRIDSQIGEGGMATVYLAEDLKHDRKVALKVLKPELAAVVGAGRFLAEIKTTANLQHPHILPLFDSGEADNFLFYVMPYVDGESLRERLDRDHQLPIDDAVRIASNVAEALDYAHRQGVIHRDIKPANVLLQDGQPVISDFGIALAVSAGGGRLTETGMSLGSPYYMSPEQATGDPDVGPMTDIYALGCVLYEMLVGEPPFTGSTPQAVLGRIISEAPPRATRQRPTVPANVEATIAKALEKLPADRFRDCSAIVEALHQPGFRHGPGAAPVTQRDALRSPRLVGALAIAAFASIVLNIAQWRSEPQVPGTVVRSLIQRPLPAPTWGSTGILSPDGRKVLFPGGATGPSTLWYVDRIDSDTLSFAISRYRPAFSPDGDSIVHYSGGNVGVLTISALSGSSHRELADSARWMGLDWTEDGWIYFFDANYSVVRVRSDGTGRESILPAVLDPTAVRPAWLDVLPGGLGLVMTRRHPDGSPDHIAFLDIPTGELRRVTEGVFAQYSPSGHLLVVKANGSLWAFPFGARSGRLVEGSEMWVADGLEVRQVGAVDVSVSASGSLLHGLAGESDAHELVFVDRSGTMGALVHRDFVGSNIGPIAVSQDGTTIVATMSRNPLGRNLWVADLESGTLRRVTRGNLDTRPAFNPDGETITFVGPRGVNWDAFETDQTGEPSLVLDHSTYVRQAFVPAGDSIIVFVTGEDDAVMAFDRSRTDQPIDTLFVSPGVRDLDLSPNGRWLAYVSEVTGRPEVHIRPLAAETNEELTVSSGGGSLPRWGSDGELFYVDRDSYLVSASVSVSGSAVSATPGVRIRSFAGFEDYDVMPDRQRFVVVRPRGPSTRGSMVLVHNWATEALAGSVN